jgi:uncharacterized membrane protein YcaP (DUF421 family)
MSSSSFTWAAGLRQAGEAALYYLLLIAVFRLAGKRLAGQTTTFDLVVLIGIGVAMQGVTLHPGRANAAIFVITVFSLHSLLADLCSRSRRLRRLVRGRPRPLVTEGQVSLEALHEERLSYDDLLAGLRKVGFQSPREVRLAILEETGHISAVGRDSGSLASAHPSVEGLSAER